MRRFDLPLLIMTGLLLAVGLSMVYSASAFLAMEQHRSAGHYVERQALAVALGLVAMLVAALTPHRRLGRYAPALFGVAVVGLLAAWIPGVGHEANGARRWISLGGLNFQPGELAKVVVLVGLASWLDRHRGRVHDLKRVLAPAIAVIAIPLVMIMAQPDFGTTAIIVVLVGVMLFLAGLRWSWVAAVGALGALGLLGLVVAASYRRARVLSFLDPFADCSGPGYQVCQSLLALQHGGATGQGLGEGVAKLLYLPEPHNDFIAAVIGEELGLLGIVAVLALFACFAWRGFIIADRAPDQLGTLLAGTLTVMIVGQACLNLMVVTSMVPPKGLVLPFVSYGASAMIVNLAAVGVLLSISASGSRAEAPAAGLAVGAAGAPT